MEYFGNCTTLEALEREHKKLILQLHPDRNPDDPDATSKFQDMQTEYDIRKAELMGDYSARGKRKSYEQWRKEKERERKANAMVDAINTARKNKGVSFKDLKFGTYIYAMKLHFSENVYEWDKLTGEELLFGVLRVGLEDAAIVKIEDIIDITDDMLMQSPLSYNLHDVYGGWETVQEADPKNGIYKRQQIAKVVMFRSEHYCLFGNPKGDLHAISDYYFPIDYETMFSDWLHVVSVEIEREDAAA